jgi:hypothetical protein
MFTFDFNDTYAGLEMDKITKRNDCFKSNKKKLRKILFFTIKTCRLAQTNIGKIYYIKLLLNYLPIFNFYNILFVP